MSSACPTLSVADDARQSRGKRARHPSRCRVVDGGGDAGPCPQKHTHKRWRLGARARRESRRFTTVTHRTPRSLLLEGRARDGGRVLAARAIILGTCGAGHASFDVRQCSASRQTIILLTSEGGGVRRRFVKGRGPPPGPRAPPAARGMQGGCCGRPAPALHVRAACGGCHAVMDMHTQGSMQGLPGVPKARGVWAACTGSLPRRETSRHLSSHRDSLSYA